MIVVNMADRPGRRTRRRATCGSRSAATCPIKQTIATTGEGVDELRDALDARWNGLRRRRTGSRDARAREAARRGAPVASEWLRTCAANGAVDRRRQPRRPRSSNFFRRQPRHGKRRRAHRYRDAGAVDQRRHRPVARGAARAATTSASRRARRSSRRSPACRSTTSTRPPTRRPLLRERHRPAGRVPVHARPAREHVPRPAVDDPPGRRLRPGRGHERPLQVPARARRDGPVDRLRPPDAARLRLRPPGLRARDGQDRRGDGHRRRRARALRRGPARPDLDVADDQRLGAVRCRDVPRGRRRARHPRGRSSPARPRTTSSRSTPPRTSSSSRRSRRSTSSSTRWSTARR